MKLSSFQMTRTLFMLTVAVLTVFGLASFLRINENPERTMLYAFYGIAMIGDAAVLLFCVWQLTKRRKAAFYLSAAVLALNVILTIFDQVGWVDILFMLLNLVTLIFLILARKEFLPA